MSYLTELVVCSRDRRDDDILSALSFELSGERFGRPGDNTGRLGTLSPLRDSFGGFKQPLGVMWAGVPNYADEQAILDHLAGVPWAEPDAVQILIRSEDERWFRIYMIRDGELVQLTPEPFG